VSAAGALRIGRAEPGPNRRIGRLFMVGSACFALASVPGASSLSDKATGAVYFVGSIFFTAAAAEQLRTTMESDRPDLIASWVQLAGTILFNLSTYNALDDRLSDRSVDLVVWSPDALGSICFLIASGIGAWAVRRAGRRARWIGGLNLGGSVAFGISAIAAAIVPNTGEAVNAAAATSWTLVGALGFLVAAYLLVPREPKAPRNANRARPSV
jgi:hypothetical protein